MEWWEWGGREKGKEKEEEEKEEEKKYWESEKQREGE